MTSFTSNLRTPAIQSRQTPRRPMQVIWSWIIELRTRRVQSAALHQLKDRDLKDIGLTDNDISAASHLPLSSDAAAALHRASLHRSGNW